MEDKADLAELPRENKVAPLSEETEMTSHLGKFSFTFLLMPFLGNLYHRLVRRVVSRNGVIFEYKKQKSKGLTYLTYDEVP